MWVWAWASLTLIWMTITFPTVSVCLHSRCTVWVHLVWRYLFHSGWCSHRNCCSQQLARRKDWVLQAVWGMCVCMCVCVSSSMLESSSLAVIFYWFSIQLLEKVSQNLEDTSTTDAEAVNNVGKNRYDYNLPCEWTVVLELSHCWPFINSHFIPGLASSSLLHYFSHNHKYTHLSVKSITLVFESSPEQSRWLETTSTPAGLMWVHDL